jgi:zinc protease
MIKRLFCVGIAFVFVFALSCEAALDVQTLVTKNNTNVWFVEDHNVPVVSVVMSFKAGTSQAPKNKVAVASFLSALLVEGAGDLDAKAFHEKLQDLGISLDVGEDLDRLTFSLRTPARSWKQALDLLKLVLSKPRFDVDAFGRVKESLLSNLENAKLTPQWQAATALNDVLYKDHPYGAMMRTAQDIHAINERDVIHFMKNLVAKDGMVVGICGDLSPLDVLAAIQELEALLPEKGFYKDIKPVVFPQKGIALSPTPKCRPFLPSRTAHGRCRLLKTEYSVLCFGRIQFSVLVDGGVAS